MELIKTDFDGLFLIKNFNSKDNRGFFSKIFNDFLLKKENINFKIKECYYSISKKNVIRGMHFQNVPGEHSKIISVLNGNILDVVLDLRKKSKTFGKYFHINLSEYSDLSIFIPVGFAHGFLSLENNTQVIYFVDSDYNPELDTGIRYNSFGYDWKIKDPILSERDMNFNEFNNQLNYF